MCAPHHAGFKCSECENDSGGGVDYLMVEGRCTECPVVDWWLVVVTFGQTVAMAVFLLHKVRNTPR